MFKLALNAGHGIHTAGKRCLKALDQNETKEWVLNSRICKRIEEKLKVYSGIEIIRLDDISGAIDVPLRERTNEANRWGADFYLSIHHNAGVNGGSGGGIMAFVYTKASAKSKEWQSELYNALINHTGLRGNRANPITTANLHECRESNMPCVLLECGFMDSSTDVPVILPDNFAEQVATACVEVIVAKAGLTKNSVTTKPVVASPTVADNKVFDWQKAAIADGFKFSKYGADGKWGNECEAVAKQAICKKRDTYKYPNLTKIVQNTVGVTADGKFGNNTKTAVINFQKLVGLNADGIVGLNTWKKILGI